ncbi:type II toxin-antitoxin system RelE/ParE family toxin [Vibrio mimicus]
MYKLSNLAAEDFEHIFEYECTEIAEGLRRHDHHKHAIFYRPQPHGVYIIRILHQQMEPLLHFQ